MALKAVRDFPEAIEALQNIVLGKIGLNISYSPSSLEIDYQSRGTKISTLIPSSQISSIGFGTKRLVILRNISILLLVFPVVIGVNVNSDFTFIFILAFLFFIAYLFIRTSIIEIQTTGGKSILFRFSGDATTNGVSDFSQFIIGSNDEIEDGSPLF